VTISRLQIAEAEKDFMHGFFEKILHARTTVGPERVPGSLARRTG
jgi:hypothetical protein